MMFYLYLKTHKKTGLKYLGYTRNDPNTYRGSGLYWKRHIKKYGYDVDTKILFQSNDIDEISKKGKFYSTEWDIANNKEFANLCEEDGNKIYGNANPNFRGHPQSHETRKKISKNNARGNLGKCGKDHPAYGHKLHQDNDNHLKKAREALKGKDVWNKGKRDLPPLSDDTKRKMSIAKIGIKKLRIRCPHCNKEGGKPAMIRFHFDNCKDKK